MRTRLREIRSAWAPLALALAIAPIVALFPDSLPAQSTPVSNAPPPSSGGIFPLSQVRRGMTATAWTVFTGTRPEPMEVEILGVLRGARGPGHDLILAQLHGAKPEYTGVVAGMSGSPVYIGNRLLGSLSYRIGQFSKDPIAGITPIEQMLEVLNLDDRQAAPPNRAAVEPRAQATQEGAQAAAAMSFQAMETPMVMSGFRPEAVRLWQQQMAGTGLDTIAAGGMGGSSETGAGSSAESDTSSATGIEPGSAVSALLIRGDLEVAATCTVTYVDRNQLLACGHPIQQAGSVSLPMTTAEVVATLASPLNAFKIVNTGNTIGAFTEDRDSAIRGVLGQVARMIPVHVSVHGPGGDRKLNVEVLDLPSLTPQALLVTLYEALIETNQSTFETSYHLTGTIQLEGASSAPLDLWASAGDSLPAPMMAALAAGERFARIYSNGARQGTIRSIDLQVQTIPRRVQVELVTARMVSTNIAHAGDTVVVEAAIRPWQQQPRNVRIPIVVPARLGSGTVRILVSDAGTLDRTLDQPRQSSRPVDLETVMAQARLQHPADRIYVSLLAPETQAGMSGQTLTALPLSVANALEPLRTAQDVNLNGESAEVVAEAPAGGVLSGFQILNLRIESGSGLD